MDLSLGFLFCSIDLYFCLCASTILSWWLWLCSRAWSQAGWLLQFHSSFSRLLWLFEVFCISIQIVKLFALLLITVIRILKIVRLCHYSEPLLCYYSEPLLCCYSVAKSCLTFATPWTAACQASLSFTISCSLLKLMSLSWWCHPTISSSVARFSFCLQSFPA